VSLTKLLLNFNFVLFSGLFKSNSFGSKRAEQPRALADGAASRDGQHRRPAGHVRQAAHGG
jgi:hypothetical protein